MLQHDLTFKMQSSCLNHILLNGELQGAPCNIGSRKITLQIYSKRWTESARTQTM